MTEPTTEELAQLEKLRADFLGKQSPGEILRGFEIVRFTGAEWDVVGKFKPTELALRQAAADYRWMQSRDPYGLYELRALVSVRREAAAPQQTTPAPTGTEG